MLSALYLALVEPSKPFLAGIGVEIDFFDLRSQLAFFGVGTAHGFGIAHCDDWLGDSRGCRFKNKIKPKDDVLVEVWSNPPKKKSWI
jgi:hypothetical protein